MGCPIGTGNKPPEIEIEEAGICRRREEVLRLHLFMRRTSGHSVRQRQRRREVRESDHDWGVDDGAAGAGDHDAYVELLGLPESLPPVDDQLVDAEGRQ